MNDRIAVVGGGAAGLMAAVAALRSGVSVTVFEKNPNVGKKLRITGKGRCNVTNDSAPEEILREITKNGKFLYSSVYSYTPSDVMDFFESCGVPLKTERGKRVFPVSDRAHDIADALQNAVISAGGEIRHKKITGLEISNGKIKGIYADGEFFPFDAVIIATGGLSYPGTGSTGDGHRMARDAGISVTPLFPSLVPMICRENCAEMMGLSLKNVTLTVYCGEKTVFSDMGEMLFTHFGISGPLVLSASARIPEGKIAECRGEIDLKPALDEETLDRRLISDFKKYAARDFVNSLGDLLPRKLISSVIRLSGIPERTRTSDINREMRKKLLFVLKHYPLTFKGFRPISEAIITRGGIDVSEVAPNTMMSKKISGLYFAGEIIDVDAYTGGFNLQIAWSTGYKAGLSAARQILG